MITYRRLIENDKCLMRYIEKNPSRRKIDDHDAPRARQAAWWKIRNYDGWKTRYWIPTGKLRSCVEVFAWTRNFPPSLYFASHFSSFSRHFSGTNTYISEFFNTFKLSYPENSQHVEQKQSMPGDTIKGSIKKFG